MTSLPVRSAAVSLAVAMSLAGLSGCLGAPVASEETRPPKVIEVAPAASSPDDPVNRVLAISIDGLNPRAIRKLGPRGAPAFHRMMREGAYTLNARTEYEMTKTVPNHTGMLTSRRIVAKKRGHGIDFNSDTGTTVHQQAGRYVASVFDVVHDRGGRTAALFSAKKKFKIYQRTWNTHGRRDKVGKNHGQKKIDRVTLDTDNARLVRAVNADLKRSPQHLHLLAISLPDVAGHKSGFMSKPYLSAVKETDRLLGTVLNTVAAKRSLRAHTLVVLTADHGGNGSNHGKPEKLENYRVPFMAWGPGVAKGRNLYAINPSFKAPKTSRPSYAGKQPIRNGDVANLVTDALDLPAIPGSELDRPRSLNVFGR